MMPYLYNLNIIKDDMEDSSIKDQFGKIIIGLAVICGILLTIEIIIHIKKYQNSN